MDLMSTAQLLGNFGEFAGAIAVVVTLFYLTVQVRHGKEAVEANTHALEVSRRLALGQAYQTRAEHVMNIAIARAESPYWATMELKVDADGMDALTPEEHLRYVQFMRAQSLLMDNLHYQHELGLIDDDFHESIFRRIAQGLGRRLIEADALSGRASFVAAVERLVAESEQTA